MLRAAPVSSGVGFRLSALRPGSSSAGMKLPRLRCLAGAENIERQHGELAACGGGVLLQVMQRRRRLGGEIGLARGEQAFEGRWSEIKIPHRDAKRDCHLMLRRLAPRGDGLHRVAPPLQPDRAEQGLAHHLAHPRHLVVECIERQ
jgi:hypothetical protein